MIPFRSWMFKPEMLEMPHLDLCREIGAFYECPKAPDGTRLGPLVGYAGTYGDPEMHFVGDVFLNFARIEKHSRILGHFADGLVDMLDSSSIEPDNSFVFCGAPDGGKMLATILADRFDAEYLSPEKKVLVPEGPGSREKTELVFGRHSLDDLDEGDQIVLVEDVVNRASTMAKMISLLESGGAQVAGIVCFLNRSTIVEDVFSPCEGREIPIVSLVRHPFDLFVQNDPFVQGDIDSGNVVWAPKKNWGPLALAMQQAATSTV